MKKILLAGLAFLLGIAPGFTAEPAFPTFKMQEVDTSYTVGYAVRLVDVNGDNKTDIVVVDSRRVVWYENPSWKRRVMIQGMTKPDNVCIAPYDIDGDGKLDFALGADWNPGNTKSGGSLQWLRQPKSLEQPWTMHAIGEEPTVHRIRFADVDGDGRAELLVGPLFGKNSSRGKNFMDGNPVRLLAYRIPKDPVNDRWTPDVLDGKHLHVMHNFWPIDADGRKGKDVLTASYEGLGLVSMKSGKRTWTKLGVGNQENLKSNRGCSEVKQGKLKGGKSVIATVEPWHGYQIVVYTPPASSGKLWDRHVIDDQLRWGHAVWFADLDGDGGDELIIGVRDDPRKGDKDKLRRGIRIYKALDATGSKWARKIVDLGGMSCEDAAAADLDGDGKVDIVACGRFTKNLRIYWNQGVK